MQETGSILVPQKPLLISAAVAVACTLALTLFGNAGALPVLGSVPLLPAVLLMAALGIGAMAYLTRCGMASTNIPRVTTASVFRLTALGAALALPPIAIDLFIPFPVGINLPLPDALFFYPAIALVAEVQFHLIPLALLAWILPNATPKHWVILPVILIEPLFQVAFLPGATLQSILVLGNVGLISAAQLWLFLRHGFAAMIGLRIAFYFFWHILWGVARLELLS